VSLCSTAIEEADLRVSYRIFHNVCRRGYAGLFFAEIL
jgi:hypothetical protein